MTRLHRTPRFKTRLLGCKTIAWVVFLFSNFNLPMTRVGVSQLLSAQLFLSCETPSRDGSNTSLFIYTKVDAVRYSFLGAAPAPSRSKTLLFFIFFYRAPRQGPLPFFPLQPSFTSNQFSLHLQKHRTYIYLLCLLHTLTIYFNAYITSAEFVLTDFCLPLIWALWVCGESSGAASTFRVSGLSGQKTSLQDHVGVTKFCRVLFILSYEKSRSRLVQSSIY